MQERKIIQQSRSFKDLDRTLKKLIKNKKAKLAGSIFEYLTKLFLEVSPEYKTKLRKVYLLNEIPTAIKRKLKLPNTDEGIDLIAETFDNEYWAIQCKFRSDKTETLKVKGDLATFNNLAFTFCKNISHGLIAATVNRPPQKKQLLNVGYILLNEWLKLDRDGGELFNQIKAKSVGKIVKPKKLSPRPHQKEAISKTISYFKSNERGKMIMPCGTGKSLTAFWIAKKMKPKSILIAVPSLALLQQTLKVWTREFLLNNIEPDWLCVCSDDTVKEEQDDFVTFSADLGIKVDTDPRVIRNFLRKKTKKLKIVFTTYQSGRATAIGSKGFKYDLGIMDEAHKTVGSGKKPMAHLLQQKNIKINKRLFMTATERLFRGDSDEYMSMDDPRDYGNLIYELSFKEAINSKPPIISDYKIITFGITTPEIEKIAEDNKYLEVKKDLKDITARELATAIALRKAIKKLKIKNAISFHRSIKRAENFRKQQDLISKIYPTYGKLKTFHVRGDMPTSDRALEMLSFEEEKGLMTNARCLTEGVDLPAIDCVCFTDPKRSKVDIVQAAGRALRLAKGKKFGYILIPIFIPDGMDFDEAAEAQGFDDVSTTVRALATTDKRIFDYLKSITEGKKPKSGSPVDGLTSINQLYKVEATKFNNAINLKVWDKVSFTNFYNFEDARNFVKKLNLSGLKDWQIYSQSKRPNYIPSSPQAVYPDKWQSWGHWLGTGAISINKIYQNLSYDDAKKLISNLKIKDISSYRKIWRSKLKKLKVPANPDKVFENRGWISWSDYLGVNIIPLRLDWRTFNEAKSFLKKIKLKSRLEYYDYLKKNILVKEKIRLPFKAPNVYKNEWVSWKDYIGPSYDAYHLSKYNVGKHLKKSISYIEGKNFLNKFNLKNISQYKRLWNKKNLSEKGFPNSPEKFYKRSGEWISWSDYLGKKFVLGTSSRNFQWLSFSDAKKFIRKYKFQTKKDYMKFRRTLPPKKLKIPANPHIVYKEFVDWKDFFGSSYNPHDISRYNNAKHLKENSDYNASKIILKNYNFSSINDYMRKWKKNKLYLKGIPKKADQFYKRRGEWKSWEDFLGIKSKKTFI
jgi:superfamily II DNA or RNA helicase